MKYWKASLPVGVAATVAVAAAVMIASGDVAAIEVFRCDADGGVMYTDVPCKGGLTLKLEPGSANPESLKRLEETRKSLDLSADRRLASMEQAAQREAEMTHWAPMEQATDNFGASAVDANVYSPYADYAYSPVWYPPPAPVRPRKPRHPKSTPPRHIAPPPPYIVPRS